VYDFPVSPPVDTVHENYRWSGYAWMQLPKQIEAGPDPKPTLTSIAPLAMTVGDPPARLTARGTLFWPNSRIVVDGVSMPTTYVSAGELYTTVDPDRAAATVPVTVEVQGVHLTPINFVFSAQPVPTLTSLSPNHAMQGATYPVTLTGTNFRADSKVTIDDVQVAATYVSATSMTTSIIAPPKGDAKITATFKVANNDAFSNPLTFNFDFITVASVSPNVGTMNEALRLTVRGTNFSAAEKITLDGVQLTTTFVSATELQADATPAYYTPPSQPPPLHQCPVNVTGSRSPAVNVALTDPRATIRSFYPDSWTEWSGRDWIECWCWGIISAQSVIYQTIENQGEQVRPTEFILNGVGTEFILNFDLAHPQNGEDQWVKIRVWNPPHHFSDSKDYWMDFAFTAKEIS
jgi:IPT/TIG domain